MSDQSALYTNRFALQMPDTDTIRLSFGAQFSNDDPEKYHTDLIMSRLKAEALIECLKDLFDLIDKGEVRKPDHKKIHVQQTKSTG